jgi:hypothetical protein
MVHTKVQECESRVVRGERVRELLQDIAAH